MLMVQPDVGNSINTRVLNFLEDSWGCVSWKVPFSSLGGGQKDGGGGILGRKHHVFKAQKYGIL